MCFREVLGHAVGKHLLRWHMADGDLAPLDQLAKEEEAQSDVLRPRAVR